MYCDVELCICSSKFYVYEVLSNAIQWLYIMYLFECHTVLNKEEKKTNYYFKV